MKVLRMKEKQQNNKNIGIMNVHQLDPFLSIILHTESVLCAKHASNHNWRIHNQFLFPQKKNEPIQLFFFLSTFCSMVCYHRVNLLFSFCLSLNFFSFTSFQVHINEEVNWTSVIFFSLFDKNDFFFSHPNLNWSNSDYFFFAFIGKECEIALQLWQSVT